jgi:hypothetical protein
MNRTRCGGRRRRLEFGEHAGEVLCLVEGVHDGVIGLALAAIQDAMPDGVEPGSVARHSGAEPTLAGGGSTPRRSDHPQDRR